jgi:penicillin amidase
VNLLRLLRLLPPALGLKLPGLGSWLARRRWPKTSGTLALAGLSAPVEVIRDRWGVPHIHARAEADLFFAQGYVHAQDRLWQMELGRRIGEGTLAALVGPPGVPVDRLTRTLGLRRYAERSLAGLDAASRAILDAYAAGVNARADREPLSIEWSFFPGRPAPWTPVDSLVRGNLLALLLGGNHRLELLRAQIVAEAGAAVAAELLPAHAPETPLIVPAEARGLAGLGGLTGLKGLDGVDGWLGDPNIVSGSNNWAVHGSRTESGKPLLANDVHIGLGLPAPFHECGLHGGRFDVVGFGLPGVPLVVMGHNGKIAWGLSNLGPDTQDFYVEKLDDPKAPRRYEHRGEWRDLEIIREEIPVRGGAPVALEIRRTNHGPILNEALDSLLRDAEPLALRWALEDSAPLVRALAGINLARSWPEFRAAAALWESPGQNFVYADAEGHIGYQATGKIPVRVPGHQGVVPVPGAAGDHEWTGFIPFDELPAALDPPAGYVATANNKVVGDDYPHLIAANWFPGYRARRITDLLEAGTRHTPADMVRIQRDTTSVTAAAIVPHLLGVAPQGELETRALAALRAWDLRLEPEAVGASIFQAAYVHLLRRVVGHRLGPTLAERYLAGEYERHGSLHMPLVIGLLGGPDEGGFGVPRAEALRLAFADGVKWLAERHGQDLDGWRWGRIHTVTWTHAPLGRTGIRWLERVFNTPALPARGDNYTVDGASFLWSKPFAVVHGTVLRMVIDLGDLARSTAVIAPGQSEHLGHPHRTDQLDLFQGGGQHPMLFTREAALAEAEGVLTLEPAAG